MAVKDLPVIRERGVCCELPRVSTRWAEDRAEVMKALADPTRLSMVATLRRHGQPVCICDLVSVFALSQPTISHHMAVLKAAGLVQVEKRGLWGFYSLSTDLRPGTMRLLDALI